MKAMSISEALQYVKKQLQPKINDVLANEVFDAVANAQRQTVYDVVYSRQTSKYQRRMDDGGLSDMEHNLIYDTSAIKYGVLYVENITPPNRFLNGVNGDMGYSSTYPEDSIVRLVEYGIYNPHGYGYDYWPDAKAAPFIAGTRRAIKIGVTPGGHSVTTATAALKTGLKRRGVSIS